MASFAIRHLGRVERSVEITGDNVILGRRVGVDIRINDSFVSGDHAALDRRPDGSYHLRDMGSSNGTWVNGVRLGETSVALPDGDVITLGQERGTLTFLSGTPEAPDAGVSASVPPAPPPRAARRGGGGGWFLASIIFALALLAGFLVLDYFGVIGPWVGVSHGFESGQVRGNNNLRAAGDQFLDDGSPDGSPFIRIGTGAEFVDDHQRSRSALTNNVQQIGHMRAEGAQGLLQALFVSDVDKYLSVDGQP